MSNLVELDEYPVKNVLAALLKDKSTKKNIIFATDSYEGIDSRTEMSIDWLKILGADAIQPRVLKSIEAQEKRQRVKAEVFTPAWICNRMNNHCDEEWFGEKDVFNIEKEQDWEPTTDKRIKFEGGRTWQKYVDSKRLEITCGEAPYIVSRYDASTGKEISVERRIGILDRKLRVVNENTFNEKDWLKWAEKAYQSVYGYEFQGDNLLIARINLLNTFVDYMQARWERVPTDQELKKFTNIITWNIWQMDGITGTIPYGKPKENYQQLSLFDYAVGINDTEEEQINCKIFDWKSNKSIEFNSIKRG